METEGQNIDRHEQSPASQTVEDLTVALFMESEDYLNALHDSGEALTIDDIDIYRYDCIFDGIIEHPQKGEHNNLLLSYLYDALKISTDSDGLRVQLAQLEAMRKKALLSKSGINFVELDATDEIEVDSYASPTPIRFMGYSGADEFAENVASKLIDEGEASLEAYNFTPDNENAFGVNSELRIATTDDSEVVIAQGSIDIGIDRHQLLHSFEGLMTLAQINHRLKHHPSLADFDAQEVYGDYSGYRFSHPKSRALRFDTSIDLSSEQAVSIGFRTLGKNDPDIIVEHMFRIYTLFDTYICPIASDVLYLMDPDTDNSFDLVLDSEIELGEGASEHDRAVAALNDKRVKGLYAAGKTQPEPEFLGELYGIDDKVARIMQVIEDGQYAEAYALMGLETKKTVVILAGESGSGKSHISQGVANHVKPDVYLEISEGLLIEGRHGESVANVDAMFKLGNGLAAEGKKVMIVCEEADTMLGAITHGDTVNPAIERINNSVVNAMKNNLNRVHPNLIIFFTTNHFEAFDPEVIASHRVALIEMFDKPSKEVIHHVVEGKINLRNSYKHQIFIDGIVDAVTHYTFELGLNPSAVKSAIDECGRRYVRRNVTLADIESMRVTLNELLAQIDSENERFKHMNKSRSTDVKVGLNRFDESSMSQEDIWRHRLGPEFEHLID